jgi:peroxiredoxin
MLNPGDPAPDFTLPDQEGNPVKLSDLKGKTVVLYFYPKADTSGYFRSNLGGCPGFFGLTLRGFRQALVEDAQRLRMQDAAGLG